MLHWPCLFLKSLGRASVERLQTARDCSFHSATVKDDSNVSQNLQITGTAFDQIAVKRLMVMSRSVHADFHHRSALVRRHPSNTFSHAHTSCDEGTRPAQVCSMTPAARRDGSAHISSRTMAETGLLFAHLHTRRWSTASSTEAWKHKSLQHADIGSTEFPCCSTRGF